MLGLIIVGLVVSNRQALKSTAAFQLFCQMRRIGKVKFKILFFGLQVRRSGASDVADGPFTQAMCI